MFNKIITNETRIAYPIELTDTPGINEAIKKIAKANDIILTKNFILNLYSKID